MVNVELQLTTPTNVVFNRFYLNVSYNQDSLHVSFALTALTGPALSAFVTVM